MTSSLASEGLEAVLQLSLNSFTGSIKNQKPGNSALVVTYSVSHHFQTSLNKWQNLSFRPAIVMIWIETEDDLSTLLQVSNLSWIYFTK
jgi:hypothetical protein